ncbi:DNA replication ATP-dependent helicase/nuclease DNA2 isoform X1 [Cucurbita moschata]|uniref:DNA helicase n=1 Tax=Cucurbita moschata TaxID=3662 RepID=A0A6J1EDH9_CUCMO|nr:DNA replication ATP-dependent helicase/nuclease DNA2 isoform X1 [Cucurbita moschata]XP_022924799.1 DNA replication ATP-dependent helicase/nuclease DNA2 isoform X1 [Cucurbita moschata]XP_022924800.1 DNA replication ATP-dependent helicase/nuclease DNA2 isoform X1 [Cucurbita moschata]XP_022924801.1 DNA replication ATP-dependent helicase/nuclease DNA2 isoform X1 [Cucurbita moschata]
MPPRKKSNSSSKKPNSNQQSEPSKFGIQHFFDRHSQNAAHSQKLTPRTSDSKTDVSDSLDRGDDPNMGRLDYKDAAAAAMVTTTAQKSELRVLPVSDAVLASENPKVPQGNDACSSSLDTTPEILIAAGGNAGHDLSNELSPQFSKSASLKRCKFSPGMLIKQSQDEGTTNDEITWKISPVNERLQAVSKQLPETIRVLANSSRLNSLRIRQCSQNKTSSVELGNFEQLSSLNPKPSERSVASLHKTGLKRLRSKHDTEPNGVAIDSLSGSRVANSQSPFRTPPSLSYCDKTANDVVERTESPDHPILRPHKKALLELLDQVEDVIAVDTVASSIDLEEDSSELQGRNGITLTPGVDSAAAEVLQKIPDTVMKASPCDFLVLEVTEKCELADTSEVKRSYKVLRLLNEQSGEERAVYLWDDWFDSIIAPGDTVNVIGEFDDQGRCHVDHDKNFVILHPDVLVSGTRVAGHLTCPRRSVLDERLRSNEQSISALIGTLLHQVFQAGLVEETPTVAFLEEVSRIVLQKSMESVYACGANEKDIGRTMNEAVPKILHWITLFKCPMGSKAPTIEFRSDDGPRKVSISEVIDIEEMAWAPKYGLKGMIDASVRVKVLSNYNTCVENVVPLEFKTGKVPAGQSSMEHCAQVILYTLLMSERYQKHVGYGLLYYLQSDQTQGIRVQRSDLVGLIMRRNELANNILKASTAQLLPPMLQIPNVCKGCRHLDVCTIYHKMQNGSKESSGLGALFDSNTDHLKASHGIFFQHWERLIDLEAKETELVKRGVWHTRSGEKNQTSTCLSSIVLSTLDGQPHCTSEKDNRISYRFVCHGSSSLCLKDSNVDSSNTESTNDMDSSLRVGDYVILSTDSGNLTLASGIIKDLSSLHISVSFSKRLRLPGSTSSTEAHDLMKQVWRIDKDEFMTSFAIMRFNLVQLLLQGEQNSHLRKLIVDLAAPRFDSGCIFSQDPAISYIWSEKNLNDDQRRAIIKILTAKDYALILGMPGTGKTSTMVHAVKALLMRGVSILLTSYTNTAVDNLLIKLKSQNIDFIRIGRINAVHEDIRSHCFSELNIQSVEDIRMRLDQVKVVAVTCLGITSPLLVNKKFDICIMDEAGQTTLPVSLGPLMFASTFVLVGDHYQLPPLVQSTEAQENGLGISLFCRLSEAHPQAISALQSQYRMCRDIMELSNALIYGDRLRCGSEETANAKLEFSGLKLSSSWLKEVVNPCKPVIFVCTDLLPAYETRDHKIVNNPIEANILAEVTKGLLDGGINGNDVGIITPYNSQASIIRLAINIASVEIHTIDKYQGRDKDCILVSFVRSSENPKSCTTSLLGDWHRINVAITRAKKKLIMVGSRKTLSKVPLLKLLIKKVEEQSGIFNVTRNDIRQSSKLPGST